MHYLTGGLIGLSSDKVKVVTQKTSEMLHRLSTVADVIIAY